MAELPDDFDELPDPPLPMQVPRAFVAASQPGDAFGLPPQCLHDVAAEIDELPTIASRWNIPLHRLRQLLETPSIKLQVEQKRAEMKASGVTFRMKAEVLAEDIMLEAYHAAKDPEASNAFKLEAAKWLTKIADREPRQTGAPAGTGFSLQINIPSATSPGQTQTIDITATPVQDTPTPPATGSMTFDFDTDTSAVDDLPQEQPEWLPADNDKVL